MTTKPPTFEKVTKLKNTAVDEVEKAVLEFVEIVKENDMTCVVMIALSPNHRIATRSVVSGNDHLKMMGALELIKTDMANELAENLWDQS